MGANRKQRAVIYARISDARDGDTAGVDRQVADCRDFIDAHGMTVVEEFIDNNRSAYRPGGKRPAYDAMLRLVSDDLVDVIVCWATDRLYRQLTDLETLTGLLTQHGVRVRTVKSGDIDLSTADGVMHAGMLAVVAKHESMKRGERVTRAARDRAEQGRFGGGVRRIGYTKGNTDLVPEEADAIAWAYRAVADGASIREVWREWNRRGLKGSQGGRIQPSQITTILRRPLNAGLTAYKGELLAGKSEAPAIIDVDTWRKVNAILADPTRTTAPRGRTTRALMTGLMTCGVCGTKMYRNRRGRSTSPYIYTCHLARHVARDSKTVDANMTALVREYLVKNAAKLRRPTSSKSTKVDKSAAQAEKLRAKLDDLALLLAAGDLDARDYARATKDVRMRLDALDAQVAASNGRPATAAILRADDIGAAWDALDSDGKRAVMSELFDSIVVDPVGPIGGNAGMDNITVTWRAA